VSDFDIKIKWLNAASNSDSVELTATMARVQIELARKNITEYRAAKAKDNDTALQIPAFYLAEWLTENWWVLLFEPQKNEDGDDSELVARHSLIAAQHGFPLPALVIMPFGRSIRLYSVPRRAPYANVQFINGASVDASRTHVEMVLRDFIQETVGRLRARGVSDTSLNLIWDEIENLTPMSVNFAS